MSTTTITDSTGAEALAGALANGVPGVVAGYTDREGTKGLQAAGVTAAGGDTPMQTDTEFAIFSCTKGITGTAVLQLVEQGDLDLHAPAANYLPEIGDMQVIEGFEADGSMRLRAPKTQLTVSHLLTHTAGLGYDFFNEHYLKVTSEHGVPSIITASMDSLRTPLLFDPGTKWEYGTNMDWAGLVVEAITGKRLGDVMQERIFDPLGMNSTGFNLTDERRAKLATMHLTAEDGSYVAAPDFLPPAEPAVHMGGHGLLSTAPDYLKFIRMWLNDGRSDGGDAVLKPETIKMAEQNQLPNDLTVTMLPGVIPSLSHDAEFFPGQRKTWGYSFMINEEEAPTGRTPGSLAWAGLANLYYWIDRQAGIGGFWATQILPFAEVPSVGGYLEFEAAAYAALRD